MKSKSALDHMEDKEVKVISRRNKSKSGEEHLKRNADQAMKRWKWKAEERKMNVKRNTSRGM